MVWLSVFNSKLTPLLQPTATTVLASTMKKLPTSQFAANRVNTSSISSGPRTTPLPMITSPGAPKDLILEDSSDNTVSASGSFRTISTTSC